MSGYSIFQQKLKNINMCINVLKGNDLTKFFPPLEKGGVGGRCSLYETLGLLPLYMVMGKGSTLL